MYRVGIFFFFSDKNDCMALWIYKRSLKCKIQMGELWVKLFLNWTVTEKIKNKKVYDLLPVIRNHKTQSDSTECTEDKAVLQKYKGCGRPIHIHTEDKMANK